MGDVVTVEVKMGERTRGLSSYLWMERGRGRRLQALFWQEQAGEGDGGEGLWGVIYIVRSNSINRNILE